MNQFMLRKAIGQEEFDYLALLNALKKYRAPRQKINELLKSGSIIRIKKGLYVFGPQAAQEPYNKLSLANLIYGPSYISLESALSFYKLIPERVEAITSVSAKKNKEYTTPLGVFTYRYLNMKKYSIGVLQVKLNTKTYALIASPEKALVDFITLNLKNFKGSLLNLFADLRLDETELSKVISLKRMEKIAEAYSNPNVKELLSYSKGVRNG